MSDELKTEDSAAKPVTRNGSGLPLITHHSSLITAEALITHKIRLGPPWQVAATDGAARHARKFGRPRMLDANEQLWLVCEHVPGAGEVRLNDTLLGSPDAPGPFAADITSLLLPRNEVTFAVASNEALGAVALEVRPA
jgi:hypothetical protein